MSIRPYRSEVVAAMEVARAQNMTIIGLSDSTANPVIPAANYGFIVVVETQQFFPSSVSTIALLERRSAS